ncbi:MAG: hypothetical protein IPJ00_10195 [Saprospirales bacterium]|nr:hypothetical protein [Saprospirales bacterium]
MPAGQVCELLPEAFLRQSRFRYLGLNFEHFHFHLIGSGGQYHAVSNPHIDPVFLGGEGFEGGCRDPLLSLEQQDPEKILVYDFFKLVHLHNDALLLRRQVALLLSQAGFSQTSVIDQPARLNGGLSPVKRKVERIADGWGEFEGEIRDLRLPAGLNPGLQLGQAIGLDLGAAQLRCLFQHLRPVIERVRPGGPVKALLERHGIGRLGKCHLWQGEGSEEEDNM